MKIAHICLIDDYAEGWSYHRNILSEQNVKDGLDTIIITTNYEMNRDGDGVFVGSGVSYTKSGIKIIRLKEKHQRFVFHKKPLRWNTAYSNLYSTLNVEKPDIVFVHNVYIHDLEDVVRYKLENSKTTLVGDNHADIHNSTAKGKEKKYYWIYRLLIAPKIRKFFKYFDGFFYITLETKMFFEKYMGIKLNNALFMPLPAPIIDLSEKIVIRRRIRNELNLSDDCLLFVHSGKLSKAKKTALVVEALKKSNLNCKVLVFGSIPDNYREELEEILCSDSRVEFRGWIEADSLREYIAAADLYLQPGSASVTMQNALAVGTPVMIYPIMSYNVYSNGCEFAVKDVDDINHVFEKIKENKNILLIKSEKAFNIANQLLDIKRQTDYLYYGKLPTYLPHGG